MGRERRIKNLIRLIVFAVVLISGFSTVSIYLASRGVALPWVYYADLGIEKTYSVDTPVAMVFSAIIAFFYHLILQRTNKAENFYYYGVLAVIMVIAVALIALYDNACGACAEMVCGSGKVQECVITWQNLIQVKISCVCR